MDFASILTMTEAEYTAMKRETGRYETMRARVKAFCDQLPDRRCYDTIAQYLRVKLRESEATKEELLWLAEQDKMQSTLEYMEHKINEADATTKPYDDRSWSQPSQKNSSNSNPFKVPEQQTRTITLKRLLSTTSAVDKAPIASTPVKKNKTSSLLYDLDSFDDDYDDEWSIVETTTAAAQTFSIAQRSVITTTAAASTATTIVTCTSTTTTSTTMATVATSSGGEVSIDDSNKDEDKDSDVAIVEGIQPTNDVPIVEGVNAASAAAAPAVEKTSIVARASLYTKQSIIEKYLKELSSILTTLDNGRHQLRMYYSYVQINNKLEGDGKEKKSLFVVSSSLKPQFVAVVGHYRQGDKKGTPTYHHHRNVVVFSECGQDVDELRKQLRLLFKAGQEYRGGFSVDSVKLPYFMVGHVHTLFMQKAIYQMLCGNGEDDDMDEEFCKSVNYVIKDLSFV